MRHNHQTISFLTLTAWTPTFESLSLSFVFLPFAVFSLPSAVCCWLSANVNSFAGCTQCHKRMWGVQKEAPGLVWFGNTLYDTMCVCVCSCVSGHLSFMWRNALPNCVQIAHTDNSFSLRHIKVFGSCPGKLLRQHVLHFCSSCQSDGATDPDRSSPEIPQSNRRCPHCPAYGSKIVELSLLSSSSSPTCLMPQLPFPLLWLHPIHIRLLEHLTRAGFEGNQLPIASYSLAAYLSTGASCHYSHLVIVRQVNFSTA